MALYEARGPGDARPFGPQLGVITRNTSTLPLTTFVAGPPPALQQAAPPAVKISFNLSSMNAVLQPGKSYTLVLTVTGTETVFVRTVPTGGSTGSAIAFKPSGGALTPLANAVARSIEGHCTYSQTSSHDVASRVTIHLEMDDGRELSSSALVSGQVAVSNEWLGAAPGELPELELDDS